MAQRATQHHDWGRACSRFPHERSVYPAPTLVLGRYKDLVSKNEDWGRQEGRESKDTVKPSASHGCPR